MSEICIAIWVNDSWVRPYLGDFLVVILLYCLMRSFLQTKTEYLLLAVLLFSYMIETLQAMDFVSLIGLQDMALARTLIGTSFSWMDMIMYTLGVAFVYPLEYRLGFEKAVKR